MNNDGFGQMGAGQDDMRMVGNDLQHYTQTGASGLPIGRMLQAEADRHAGAKGLRLLDLERSYNR